MRTPNLKDAPTAPAGGNFISLLQTKNGGVSLAELDEALATLTEAVVQTARAGTLTLKLKISPNVKGVKIEDELTLKEPKPTRGVSFAYVGPGFALLKNDPDQMTMQLHAVPSEAPQAPRAVAQ